MPQPPRFNPNKRRNKVNSYIHLSDADKAALYPDFVTSIHLEKFRHLNDIKLDFISPITVITGSNKSGKSSILLCLGCSHYNFYAKNPVSGKYERTGWGNVMRFTSYDRQDDDWKYVICNRKGGHNEDPHKGKRNHTTKKWSGCAKKEGKIGNPGPNRKESPNGRNVYLIDLERIIPGRHHPITVYNKVKSAREKAVDRLVTAYLSYILENKYTAYELGGSGEKRVYSYKTRNRYTSFNTASGEDVLTHMLVDIVTAQDNSLILIEEIEIGLHPKIQRRLLDILYFESLSHRKQFIITTHSSTVLESVEPSSRILLQKMPDDTVSVRAGISIKGALSEMDAISYPLLSIYVEDDISQRLVQESLNIAMLTKPELRKKVIIVPVGSAKSTYDYFKQRMATDGIDRLKRGFACILDGDKREEKYRNGDLCFPAEVLLFFHHTNEAPERMLLREFLKHHPNAQLEYHVDDGNAHNLMQKIVDEGLAASPDIALSRCIEYLKHDVDGNRYFNEMADFIKHSCEQFMLNL